VTRSNSIVSAHDTDLDRQIALNLLTKKVPPDY
jgi:hypothetical protein